MKILLSAFACDPALGSEEGIGWNWAFNLARAGHDVWVLTRDYYQPSIESTLRRLNVPTLHFEYVSVRYVRFWIPGPGVYPYYMCWQWKAYCHAKQLHREHRFEIIHHITYGAFRNPSYLYLLRGPAFVFGPVGGGERSPAALRKNMSGAGRRFEIVRDIANVLPHFDPFWQSMLRRCTRIVAKTEETRACFPKYLSDRVVIALEHMILEKTKLAGKPDRVPPLKLLFVGRLLHWKGAHLALQAIAIAVTRGRVELTIVGKGEEEPRLKAEARRLNIESFIHFTPWIPKSEVLELYETHDALLFPSLHDSGGTVVIEAISLGKPVICLDLGGPAVTVDHQCARIVDTRGKSEEQVVQGIAEAILQFCHMSSRDWENLRKAALQRAQHYTPERVIARVYGPLLSEKGLGPEREMVTRPGKNDCRVQTISKSCD